MNAGAMNPCRSIQPIEWGSTPRSRGPELLVRMAGIIHDLLHDPLPGVPLAEPHFRVRPWAGTCRVLVNNHLVMRSSKFSATSDFQLQATAASALAGGIGGVVP